MGISQQIGASSMVKWGICTSSTRPASPYHGQHIYETDTNLQFVWNGSAWVNNYASSASPTFTGTVTIPAGASISGFAPLASPALTGIPTAPTATVGTNTTQLATTAFVNESTGMLPNIVETTSATSLATNSTTYVATTLSVTINKSQSNSAIWIVASPQLSLYTGGGGGVDTMLSARLVETNSSRQRDFLGVLRTYNVNGDARVNSTKACLQWMDPTSGTGSRTYRLDIKVDSNLRTGEFNMYANNMCLSEITALEVFL